MSISLAPCPLCGSKAEFRQPHYGPEILRKHSWYVVCEYNCVRTVGDHGTQESIAQVWNRRKHSDKLALVIEAALEQFRDASKAKP